MWHYELFWVRPETWSCSGCPKGPWYIQSSEKSLSQQRYLLLVIRSSLCTWIKFHLSANTANRENNFFFFTDLSVSRGPTLKIFQPEVEWGSLMWTEVLTCLIWGYIFKQYGLIFQGLTDLGNILKKVNQVWKMSCFGDCSSHKGPRQTALHTECSCICQLLSNPWNIHMFMLCSLSYFNYF